jgi:hypothetical protein
MHREWVDLPVWGTLRTRAGAGLEAVDLARTPRLTIRYRIQAGRDPLHLWAIWRGSSGKERRCRIWRSFAPPGEWRTDTLDLRHALRCRGEEPREILALEFGTQRPPQAVRLALLEITD